MAEYKMIGRVLYKLTLVTETYTWDNHDGRFAYINHPTRETETREVERWVDVEERDPEYRVGLAIVDPAAYKALLATEKAASDAAAEVERSARQVLAVGVAAVKKCDLSSELAEYFDGWNEQLKTLQRLQRFVAAVKALPKIKLDEHILTKCGGGSVGRHLSELGMSGVMNENDDLRPGTVGCIGRIVWRHFNPCEWDGFRQYQEAQKKPEETKLEILGEGKPAEMSALMGLQAAFGGRKKR